MLDKCVPPKGRHQAAFFIGHSFCSLLQEGFRMFRICSFRLDNGRRCHCAANRGLDFCRHHTPEALRVRHAAEPEFSDEAEIAFSPRREWGQLRTFIMGSEAEAFDDILEGFMTGMADGIMTPRTAGRLLLLLYRRREELKLDGPAAPGTEKGGAGHPLRLALQPVPSDLLSTRLVASDLFSIN
jgi:hypothetical protein